MGAVFDTQHGLANGVILPYVLQVNKPVVQQKFEVLARCLDLPAATDGPTSTGFDATAQWVNQMRSKLQLPHTLAEIEQGGKIERDTAEMMGHKAAMNPTGFTNPIR